MALIVKDGNNTSQSLSTTTNPLDGGALVGSTAITDPVTGNKAQIAQFHNADNQNPGPTAYGILAGGVAQILNASGNLDRQREAGLDGVSAVGMTTSAANFAMAFKTTIAASIVANAAPQAVTPARMSGVIGGVSWSIQVGSVVSVDTGASFENVIVTAVTATTFSAVFTKAHTGPVSINSFVYNQERDAAGEADGASGIGTAVAAEYEYNGVGPGGASFDRARSVQAKGRTTTTVTGGTQNATSITIGAAGTLRAGTQVILFKAATFPAAGSFEAIYVDFSYVEGTTTVPLASAIVGNAGYDTLAYDSFAAMGPGLNGFSVTGVGIEEEALYDPVSGLFYLERAATQDAMQPQNVVAENPGLFNGATIDRQRGNIDTAALITHSAAAAGVSGADQMNVNARGVQVGVNITAGTGTSPTLQVIVEGKDAASGAYYPLFASAAIAATPGFTALSVYPGLTASATAANQVLPRTWRVRSVIGGTTPAVTATIGASVIV